MAGYNVKSEKVVGAIITRYLDMLGRGEIKDLFGDGDGGDDGLED